MAAIYDAIQAALESNLADIPSIPTIIWENTNTEPVSGQEYIVTSFAPTIRRPAVRGLNPQQYYQGIFAVNCYAPADKGSGAANTLAEKVIENFEATSDLTAKGKTISIRTAERRMGMKVNNHYLVPVIIDWYIYD